MALDQFEIPAVDLPEHLLVLDAGDNDRNIQGLGHRANQGGHGPDALLYRAFLQEAGVDLQAADLQGGQIQQGQETPAKVIDLGQDP